MLSFKKGFKFPSILLRNPIKSREDICSQDGLLSQSYVDSEKDEAERSTCEECNGRRSHNDKSSYRRLRCLTISLFALFNMAALAFIWGAIRDMSDGIGPETFFPKMDLVPVTFQDPRLGDTPDPTSDSAWQDDLPSGDGFLYIPDPERYNLPPGGLSTIHGQMLHSSLSHAVRTNSTLVPPNDDSMMALHLFHCLDYIRQGVVCNMDTTIEWPTSMGHQHVTHINGYGIPHMCKNKELVHKFMIEHAVP